MVHPLLVFAVFSPISEFVIPFAVDLIKFPD